MEERGPKFERCAIFINKVNQSTPQHNTTTATAEYARPAQHRNLPRNHRPVSVGLEAIDDDLLDVHG